VAGRAVVVLDGGMSVTAVLTGVDTSDVVAWPTSSTCWQVTWLSHATRPRDDPGSRFDVVACDDVWVCVLA